MAPGDVIFLEEAAMLRGVLESLFFAVLACPVCGTPGMVSAAQCRGLVPVTCGAGKCSCRFRIDADGSLVYLLVN